MTIFGTMLSTFMITLGLLLATLATHGRFGPLPSLFTRTTAAPTALPEPVKPAAPAATVSLQPSKTRFVAVEPAPVPSQARPAVDRPVGPAMKTVRKPAPRKPQQQQALAPAAPKPHQRPAASGWGWGWDLPIFRN